MCLGFGVPDPLPEVGNIKASAVLKVSRRSRQRQCRVVEVPHAESGGNYDGLSKGHVPVTLLRFAVLVFAHRHQTMKAIVAQNSYTRIRTSAVAAPLYIIPPVP